MRQFVVEVLFPNLAYVFIRFVLGKRVVQVALGVFVHQQFLQPSACCVLQSAVQRHVLFLYHGNFRVQLPSELVLVEVGLVHVVVHCLLLGGGQDVDV